jgi:prevent-host-death family protein
MCYRVYMTERRVGVRELRQNLSQYLRRVERGERLEVTEHGRPVAVLAPIGEPDSPIERLVAAGRAIAPSVDITTLLPPKGRTSTRTSEALLEDRRDRV